MAKKKNTEIDPVVDISKYKPVYPKEIPVDEELNIVNNPVVESQNNSNSMGNFPSSIFSSFVNDLGIQNNPLNYSQNNPNNIQNNSTEQSLLDEVYKNDQKALNEYALANNLITGINVVRNIKNLKSKSNAEPIKAPVLEKPTLVSNVAAQTAQLNESLGEQQAILRNMQETGMTDPNVMLAGSANILNAELQQKGKIAQEENARINEQSKIDAEIANQQAQINTNTEVMNKQMQMEDNMRRSAEKTNAEQNILSAIQQGAASNLDVNDKKTRSKIMLETLKGMDQTQRQNYFLNQYYNYTGQTMNKPTTTKDNSNMGEFVKSLNKEQKDQLIKELSGE